jgi:hypothetical protein
MRGGVPVALDAFDKPETLGSLCSRLVSGYALDALGCRPAPARAEAITAFIDDTAGAHITTHDGPAGLAESREGDSRNVVRLTAAGAPHLQDERNGARRSPEERGKEMHPSIQKVMVDGRIAQLHHEAETARLIKSSSSLDRKPDAGPKRGTHFLLRLATSLVVSALLIVALTTTALAFPVRPVDEGKSRRAGVVRPEAPAVEINRTPGFNPAIIWITVGSMVLLTGAGVTFQVHRRVGAV